MKRVSPGDPPGPAVQKARVVILAMGQGRKAAMAINEYLKTGVW